MEKDVELLARYTFACVARAAFRKREQTFELRVSCDELAYDRERAVRIRVIADERSQDVERRATKLVRLAFLRLSLRPAHSCNKMLRRAAVKVSRCLSPNYLSPREGATRIDLAESFSVSVRGADILIHWRDLQNAVAWSFREHVEFLVSDEQLRGIRFKGLSEWEMRTFTSHASANGKHQP